MMIPRWVALAGFMLICIGAGKSWRWVMFSGAVLQLVAALLLAETP